MHAKSVGVQGPPFGGVWKLGDWGASSEHKVMVGPFKKVWWAACDSRAAGQVIERESNGKGSGDCTTRKVLKKHEDKRLEGYDSNRFKNRSFSERIAIPDSRSNAPILISKAKGGAVGAIAFMTLDSRLSMVTAVSDVLVTGRIVDKGASGVCEH
ncbi:hypothetical protein TNCV_3869091 [Trichonephila clavipes]|nr:hypothetical protein TNCV_3869091 [Trichonephila clavipes]